MGFRDILEKNVRALSQQRAGSTGNLHERVRLDLKQRFPGSRGIEQDALPGAPLQDMPAADLVISQGQRVAVVEIKMGNPELPLPSSTPSQMHLLAEQAKQHYSEDVITVLVTNYSVTPDDKRELEDEGIKVVPVAPALSLYDPEHFSREFAETVGLRLAPAALDAAS